VTSLDDALNSSAPVFHPSEIYAEWQELPTNNSASTNADNPRDLGSQLLSYTVEQSLEDGLPDAVTMTNGNDASGKLLASLAGRPGVYADTLVWRTGLASGTGTGLIITTTLPADTGWGDYSIVAVSANSNPIATDISQDGTNDWKLLSFLDDGATLKTWVYGREWYAGSTGPLLSLSASASWSWVAVSVSGKTANGSNTVSFKPGTVVSAAESVSGTAHNAPSATLSRRGYVVGVWARVAASAGWSVAVGTEINEAAAVVDVSVSTTPLMDPGSYVVTGTSSTATAIATMTAIPLMVMDRPAMDAVAYFSPFNKSSPLYGFDRDTAPVSAQLNVVTATGVVGTDIFHGQMADIGVRGRQAELSAVSKTRLDMDRSLVVPKVWGLREGVGVDYLATWLMARGGQFAGPAPTPLTVSWVPGYGSTHASLENFRSSNFYQMFNGDPFQTTQPFGVRPAEIPGPFYSALFCEQTATQTQQAILSSIEKRPRFTQRETLPYIEEMTPGGNQNDQMSQQCSQGRLTVWLRGDPVVHNPTYMTDPTTDSYIFRHQLQVLDRVGTLLGTVSVHIQSVDRQVNTTIGSISGGTYSVLMSSVGTLPSDGQWHFFGFSWDWKSGEIKVKIDATESASTYWRDTHPTGDNDIPVTDAAGLAASGQLINYTRFHVPFSDFQVEAGAGAFTGPWTDFYPTPAWPGKNAIIRPTYQQMEALSEATPLLAWNTLSELAQGTLSAYRTDEDDAYNFLPLTYFGEPAQLTSTTVFDTEVNASELDVIVDPSKIRNVVTIKYPETRVDGPSSVTNILTITSPVEIPRGKSQITFSLDAPIAEVWSEGNPGDLVSGNWIMTNLTALQIAGTNPLPTYGHYFSGNTLPDGSGTVTSNLSIIGRLVSNTASTVTIEFINRMPRSGYLANNGNGIPFLVVRGIQIHITDGYVTISDAGSVGTRRERALEVEMPWIQRREEAFEIASSLASILSRPRPQVGLTVMGDPRRKPGQLVTVADSEGTQAEGWWRILSITSNSQGAQFTQDLALVQVMPVAVWDGPDGWDYSVWGA
jgi:hypothetical protein